MIDSVRIMDTRIQTLDDQADRYHRRRRGCCRSLGRSGDHLARDGTILQTLSGLPLGPAARTGGPVADAGPRIEIDRCDEDRDRHLS